MGNVQERTSFCESGNLSATESKVVADGFDRLVLMREKGRFCDGGFCDGCWHPTESFSRDYRDPPSKNVTGVPLAREIQHSKFSFRVFNPLGILSQLSRLAISIILLSAHDSTCRNIYAPKDLEGIIQRIHRYRK